MNLLYGTRHDGIFMGGGVCVCSIYEFVYVNTNIRKPLQCKVD